MTVEQPDWHLREWMQHFGKRQASLVNELGWTKGRANYVWHSHSPYYRDSVNELSRWLGIKPYELLMPPGEAMALRRLRETAAMIVAEQDQAPYDVGVSARPAQKRAAGR